MGVVYVCVSDACYDRYVRSGLVSESVGCWVSVYVRVSVSVSK